MFSGSPLAKRPIVCASGRSSRENAAGALHEIGVAAGTVADGVASGLVMSPGNGCGAEVATAGIAAGVAADAATGVNSGATKSAGSAACASAAVCTAKMCTAKIAVAAAAHLKQAIIF